jgi:hypothetical protein
VSVLLVYFFHDLQLLLSGPDDHYARRLGPYAAAILVYGGGLGVITRSLNPNQVLSLYRSPAVWVPCLVVHLILALFSLWMRNRQPNERAWMAVLAPAPVFLLSMLALACLVSSRSPTRSLPIICLALIVVWSCLLSAAVVWIGDASFTGQDTGLAVDFMTVTNAALVMVAPLNLLLGNLEVLP